MPSEDTRLRILAPYQLVEGDACLPHSPSASVRLAAATAHVENCFLYLWPSPLTGGRRRLASPLISRGRSSQVGHFGVLLRAAMLLKLALGLQQPLVGDRERPDWRTRLARSASGRRPARRLKEVQFAPWCGSSWDCLESGGPAWRAPLIEVAEVAGDVGLPMAAGVICTDGPARVQLCGRVGGPTGSGQLE